MCGVCDTWCVTYVVSVSSEGWRIVAKTPDAHAHLQASPLSAMVHPGAHRARGAQIVKQKEPSVVSIAGVRGGTEAAHQGACVCGESFGIERFCCRCVI